MISALLTVGAFALKWIGGGAGILGAISALVRIPFVSGWLAAVPVIGPIITEAAKVFLGWLDSVARFVVRATLALLEAVSGRPIIAVPILLALWGQQLYFEHWKYRQWTPPPVAPIAAPARAPEDEPSPRSLIDDLFGPRLSPGLSGKNPAPAKTSRRPPPPPSNDPFSWIERNFRF